MMRHMGAKNAVYGVDIDQTMVDYVQGWIGRCDLEEYVKLVCSDSANPEQPARATEYFALAPQMLLIDSAHQYPHTLRELELWTGALAPGGLIFLHDTSVYAAQYDRAGQGGVHRAFAEWTAAHPEFRALNLWSHSGQHLVYDDICGLGILQKSD